MYQPYAGGWRFGDRPTSVDALYQPKPTDNDFLKRVAAMANGQTPQQGLLDQSLSAQPLQGLLDSGLGGGQDFGQERGTTSGTTGIGVGNMSTARDQAAMGAAGTAFMSNPGLLGLVSAARAGSGVVNDTNKTVLDYANSTSDPIMALAAIQNWGIIDQQALEKMQGGLLGMSGDGYGYGGGYGGTGDVGPGGYGLGDGGYGPQ